MSRTHTDPSEIHRPPNGAYSHVVTVEAGRLAFVSGQVAYDRTGRLVGGDDVGAQARQCFANLRAALSSVGAEPGDLVRLTTYVVDYEPSHRAALAAARQEVLALDPPPASTLVGVAALATEELRVEVEAIAVLDRGSR